MKVILYGVLLAGSVLGSAGELVEPFFTTAAAVPRNYVVPSVKSSKKFKTARVRSTGLSNHGIRAEFQKARASQNPASLPLDEKADTSVHSNVQSTAQPLSLLLAAAGTASAAAMLALYKHAKKTISKEGSEKQPLLAGAEEMRDTLGKVATGVAAAAAVSASPAHALTYDELQALTYLQVKGTGLANTCPIVQSEGGPLDVKPGEYNFDRFCVEPTSFTVAELKSDGQKDFALTKLMTRLTYTLDGMTGDFNVAKDGTVQVQERDGLDYAPVTVQLAGGERVPFLFTLKELKATGTVSRFAGDFTVASYRGSSFLDPKGRGGSTGYDNAVALPARSDAEDLQRENQKDTTPLRGAAEFNTVKYNPNTGEIAGIFTSVQPSDTDLGAKVPKDVKVTGLWYAQLLKK